eukprot:TRINITY_DN4484_c0_g1_i4.p1 TRINITY_DN4484_c0_g1~~TRINITY_DN4484_c0_g1_i4.p1  ORF type:complete len:792 (-),score=123.73 TRINITY_DN4484_c0_g1_i4:187-2562(-)
MPRVVGAETLESRAKKKRNSLQHPHTSQWGDYLFPSPEKGPVFMILLHNCSVLFAILCCIVRIIVNAGFYKELDGYYVFPSDAMNVLYWLMYLKMNKIASDTQNPMDLSMRVLGFLSFVSATLRFAQIIHEFDMDPAQFIWILQYPSFLILAAFSIFPPKHEMLYEPLSTFEDQSGSAQDPVDDENLPHPFLMLVPYFWPRTHVGTKIRVVLSFALLIVGKVTNILVPLWLSQAVNDLSNYDNSDQDSIPWPWKAIILYASFRLLSASSDNFRNALFVKVTEDGMRRACVEVFEHLFDLSLRFHVTRQTGAVLRAVDRGSRAISGLLQFGLFNIVPTLFEVSMVIGVLWFKYNPWYGIITLCDMCLYVFFTFSMAEYRKKLRREMNQRENEANNMAVDGLLNFETVKYFNNELHEVNRYNKSLESYVVSSIRSQVSLSLLNIGQQATIAVGVAIVLLLGAKEVQKGILNVGDFVLLNSYMIQIFIPLNFLGSSYNVVKQAQVDLENMFVLLRVNKEIKDAEDATNFKPVGGEVVFDNVQFSYQKDVPILRGISFRVPPGKMLAIVGPTGSGKTTVSRLLYRFYDTTEGTIKIDGQDIKEVTQRSFRKHIGIVPQDTVLFNETIAYNIAYGAIGASQSQVENAARGASIHDFISRLPEGYQTKVGERGLRLSGGEKQRVSIARLLLKNPLIMIFDEATSALDSKTEANIQKSLAEMSTGRTTIAVAHRLSTIVNADEIIVLKSGVIVERGTHPQLLSLRGEYAQMWAQQAEEAHINKSQPESSSTPAKPHDE